MGRLLVIDFDFWFPNLGEAGAAPAGTTYLWDWGHAEAPIYLSNDLWATRAAAFLAYDQPVPEVVPPVRGWASFWDRFSFTPDAPLFYADSNALSGHLAMPDGEPFDEVVLFDAHHDCGYGVASLSEFAERGQFSCEDWMLVHALHGARLSVRYPLWKPKGPQENVPKGVPVQRSLDDGVPIEGPFDVVFVCRSGAWVPPWSDPQFLELINSAPLEAIQIDDLPMDRAFDMADAHAFARQMRHSRPDNLNEPPAV